MESVTVISAQRGEAKSTDHHLHMANLDFDLSAYHPALFACDLGRAQDVVSLRGWQAERLHLALEKAVPQLSVAERTALARGIKGITKEGTIGKSVARVSHLASCKCQDEYSLDISRCSNAWTRLR